MTTRSHPSGFSVGDIVEFGRTHGEKTRGRITATHGGSNGSGQPLKSLKVEQLEERGTLRIRSAGTTWKVPPSLMRKVDGASSTPAAPKSTPHYSVGQPVRYMGKTAERGKLIDIEVVGVITRVSDATYEVFGRDFFGRNHELRHDQILGAASKRPEADIMSALCTVYSRLSPENLSCDGEASRAHMSRVRGECNRALRALQTELGRRVSEDEAYRAVA